MTAPPHDDPLVGWVLLPGLLALLVAAPLAFGAVQPWAFAAVFVLVATLFTVQLARPRVLLATPPLLPAMGLAGVIVAIQLLPAFGPLTANRHATFEALVKGTSYALTFLLAARVGRRRRHARWLLAGLVAIATFEALYGLSAQSSASDTIFGYRKPTGSSRASGTYVNPDHLAGLLEMALPIAVALLATWRWPLQLPRPLKARAITMLGHPTFPARALLAAAILLVGVGLLGTLSRGGLVGALCGFAVLALALLPAGTRLRLGLGASALGVALALTLASDLVDRVVARLDDVSRETSLTTTTRLAIARDTLPLLGDHPWLGAGAGTFPDVFPHYQTFDSGRHFVNQAHCDLLELLVDLGVPGGLALLAAVAATFALAWRGARASADPQRRHLALMSLAGFAALAAHSAFDFNLRIPANALWCATLLGLTWGLARPDDGFRVLEAPKAPWSRCALLALTALWLGSLGAGAVQLARGDWAAQPFIERAQGDRRPLEARLVSLELAIARWPFRPEHHVLLGRLRWDLAWQAARAEVDASARLLLGEEDPPERVRQDLAEQLLQLRLGEDRAFRGALDQEAALALEHFTRAHLLAPGSPLPLQAARALKGASFSFTCAPSQPCEHRWRAR